MKYYSEKLDKLFDTEEALLNQKKRRRTKKKKPLPKEIKLPLKEKNLFRK